MQMQLFEYVKQYKNHRNSRIGVLLATKIAEDQVMISWSKYHAHKEKFPFDPERGKMIAENRLVAGCHAQVPHSFRKQIDKFTDRVRRYFKVDPNSITIVGKN